MKPNRNSSLSEVWAWFRKRLDSGTKCPCCGRFAKNYRRTLTAKMAHGLTRIEETHPKGWFDAKSLFKRSSARDWSVTKHWGLVKAKPGKAGIWKLTKLGRQFVRGKVEVHRRATVFNDKCLGLDGDMVTIQDVRAIPERGNSPERFN